MNHDRLYEIVHVQVPAAVMKDLIEFVTTNDPGWRIWNRTTDGNAISDWCYVYLYKMITAEGITKLEQELELQPNLKFTHHSIYNNTTVIHTMAYRWAQTKIQLENAEAWDAAVVSRHFEELFEDVNLWIDSSDFPLRKSEDFKDWHSRKLSGSGIKIQFLFDATERIRYMKGPLDPGQTDDCFLQIRRCEIEEQFKGAQIIGDSTYAIGTKLFTDPVFYCPAKESGLDRQIAEKENLPSTPNHATAGRKRKAEIDLETISEEDKGKSMKKLKRNAVLHNTRELVSTGSVFETMKSKFEMIRGKHIQDKDFLYETVVIAAGIHNTILSQKAV
jgi:hypothetical protein